MKHDRRKNDRNAKKRNTQDIAVPIETMTAIKADKQRMGAARKPISKQFPSESHRPRADGWGLIFFRPELYYSAPRKPPKNPPPRNHSAPNPSSEKVSHKGKKRRGGGERERNLRPFVRCRN